MPKYDYHCEKCNFVFQFRHEISEKLEKHPDCDQKECDIHKVPSYFRLVIPLQKKANYKPGRLVQKHIEEAKEEVKNQKEDMKKELDE